MNYAMQRGKRIRPLIVLLCYDAIGAATPLVDSPIPAAIAVEIIHTESTIHDDIIDGDTVRRDLPTFHERYGLNPSILTADFVLGIILDIASQYADSRIGRELSRAVLRMSEGEYSELRIQTEGRKIDSEEYVEIITNKTASLFQASARIGARAGSATASGASCTYQVGASSFITWAADAPSGP